MSIVSKGACGLIALMYLAISISHLKDPEASLRDFGVQGDISPIAVHCCAIIGATACPIIAMMVYAIGASAAVRGALLMCFMTTIIPGILVQIWYPFNDPAPTFPGEMPYPVLILQVALGLAGIAMNADDPKTKEN